MNDVTFTRKIVSILSDNKFDREVGGKRKGKINTKKLYRIGYDDRVFKQKEERKNKEYAVSILVDCSGSMHTAYEYSKNRAYMAGDAADKIYRALETAGIRVEVRGFNMFPAIAFKRFDEKKLPKGAVLKETLDHTYNNPLNFIIDESTNKVIPQWDENYGKVVKSSAIKYSSYTAPSCNCDGEAIAFARERLNKEKGVKILFVLSDGQPACYDNIWSYHNPTKKYGEYILAGEIKKCIDDGIIVFGVGIQSSDVKSFYPKENVEIIEELSELYPKIVGRLQKLIKRG